VGAKVAQRSGQHQRLGGRAGHKNRNPQDKDQVIE
jgi:hypothetical protein